MAQMHSDLEEESRERHAAQYRTAKLMFLCTIAILVLASIAVHLSGDFPTWAEVTIHCCFAVIAFIVLLVLHFSKVETGAMVRAAGVLETAIGRTVRVLGGWLSVDMDPVFVVYRSGMSQVFFIAVVGGERCTACRARMPVLPWGWREVVEIDGVRLSRLEGTYAVPTETLDLVKGKGVAYVLSLYDPALNRRGNELTPGLARRIIESLCEDAGVPDPYSDWG